MSKELSSQYIAKEHEDQIYKMWEDSGVFAPENQKSMSARLAGKIKNQKSFSIIMPPPNSNGSLHIGHAVFVTVEDIMIRYHRMAGEKTLWLPGADHAGFETQVVYNKKLEKEGRNFFQIPREQLYQEILDFTLKNKTTMEGQLRKLGASCDWSREIFTLDPRIIKIVYQTFKKLYDQGLAYRGERICNWCVKHQTTLSDLEIKHEDKAGMLTYIKYPIKKSQITNHKSQTNPKLQIQNLPDYIVVATTRPETMLGDTAVAVHPKDKRYANLIGQTVILPLTGRGIPILGDLAIEKDFGTGAVKVTPAHDPLDFEIGQRHNLAKIEIINKFGKIISPAPEKYVGLKIMEAREKIVADLKELGLIEKEDPFNHAVSVCYKCAQTIEPLVLPQWFIKVKPLTEQTLKAVKAGKTKFVTKKFEKILLHWLKNLRDWNISRQIVWGIRIPVWYRPLRFPPLRVRGGEEGLRTTHNPPQPSLTLREGDKTEEIYVGEKPPQGDGWIQDTDVFDTWFSSGQWPFATLQTTGDFKEFYPTAVMETGYDILPFWVMRMLMLGLFMTGEVPFQHVYLHGMVRDKDRQKMSKSKGNVIDPLGVIELYGADALRMAIVVGNTAGNDIIISEDKIKGYRNFANKIWNASRFVMMNLSGNPCLFSPLCKGEKEGVILTSADQKILKELNATVKKVTSYLDKYDFNHAAETAYHYFWHTFADKVIEQMKPRLNNAPQPPLNLRGGEPQNPPLKIRGGAGGVMNNQDRHAAQYLLYTILTTSLKLLHPFMPFVTETIWQEMFDKKSMLITESWPKSTKK